MVNGVDGVERAENGLEIVRLGARQCGGKTIVWPLGRPEMVEEHEIDMKAVSNLLKRLGKGDCNIRFEWDDRPPGQG